MRNWLLSGTRLMRGCTGRQVSRGSYITVQTCMASIGRRAAPITPKNYAASLPRIPLTSLSLAYIPK